MSGVAFTGERLHEGSELFAVDLVRHRAAYAFAIERAKVAVYSTWAAVPATEPQSSPTRVRARSG
jgi:hypothetical protein